MNRQLDDVAADYLLRKLESMQIRIITPSGVRKILGDGRVTGVVSRDGTTLDCDTVLLCVGIKPTIELARNARIKVGTGILVDDHLRTSADHVYAIGECCEHRGKTYVYRKLVTCKGRLIGAAGYADWPEIRRIQEAYQFRRRLFPWQIIRFLASGANDLVTGARDFEQFYLLDELQQLGDRASNLQAYWVTQHKDEQQVCPVINLEFSDIYQFLARQFVLTRYTRIYLCAAESFARKMKKQCYLHGAALQNIRADAFLPCS